MMVITWYDNPTCIGWTGILIFGRGKQVYIFDDILRTRENVFISFKTVKTRAISSNKTTLSSTRNKDQNSYSIYIYMVTQ